MCVCMYICVYVYVYVYIHTHTTCGALKEKEVPNVFYILIILIEPERAQNQKTSDQQQL